MILTPDQRLRVFVSSTLLELADERAAVRRAVEGLRLAPVMFEIGARPHQPRALYRAYLEQSHIFLGLYWQQYGWVAPDMDISGLEDELGLSQGLPRLLYIKEPAPERDPRLARLIERVEADATSSYRIFGTAEELHDQVAEDLAVLLSERFTNAGADEAPVAAAAPLPVPTTSFVGRSREIAEVRDLLVSDDVRLVTLVGAGGIGKTRLALEVGTGLKGAFPDGIHFIPLSHVTEPVLVVPVIANTLGIRTEDRGLQRSGLQEAIRGRRVLLIIDNFEQVIDAAPDLGGLLEHCPQLKILATSRRALRLRAEREYHVQPLSLPAGPVSDEADLAGSDAAQLFLQRARAIRPDLALNPAEARAVAELARRVDGIPLATELAAARVRLLSPSALLARLCKNFDLLSGTLGDLPERQRSLRATLDWSHALLTADQQHLFARLSTFVDGFTLDAAETICGEQGSEADVLDLLTALVDSSLVQIGGQDTEAIRFRMLAPVREYAREKLTALGEKHATDARHTDYFVALCKEAGKHLRGPDQARWLDRLEAEDGNLGVSARRCLLVGDYLPLAETVWHLWVWLWLNDHITPALYWTEEAVRRAEEFEPLVRARLLWAHGAALFEQGKYERAEPLLVEAGRLFDELDDGYGRALADIFLASLSVEAGDIATAAERFRASAEALRRHGDRFTVGVPAGSLGLLLLLHGGDPAEANRLFADALTDALSISNQPMIALTRLYQGLGKLLEGDPERAAALHRQVVGTFGHRRSDEILAYGLDGLAAVSLQAGDTAHATTLLGAAAGLRERSALSPWPLVRPLIDGLVDAARAALPAEQFDIAWQAGRALDRAGARRFALESTAAEPAKPQSLDA